MSIFLFIKPKRFMGSCLSLSLSKMCIPLSLSKTIERRRDDGALLGLFALGVGWVWVVAKVSRLDPLALARWCYW